MKSFGNHLKRAREAKGVTLDSVANATRISRRYLQALELGDLDALPGGAFDKGYIKTYAEFVGIDPGPALAAYQEEAERCGRGAAESDRQMLEKMGKLVDRRGSGRPQRGGRGVLYAGAVLALVAGGVWLALPGNEPVPEPGLEKPATARRAEPEPSPPAPEPERVEDTPDVRITQSGVGTEIVERNLSGQGTQFVEGTTLWFWTRVVGGEAGEHIQHVWIHEGRTSMRAELTVGGSHWRTYSTLTLPPGSAGPWIVEARTADNKLLARNEFVCLSAREGT